MSDMLTLAEYRLYDANTSSTDDALIQNYVIPAATGTVSKFCNRIFEQSSYDELYDGTGYRELQLDHYPVIQVDRISTFRQAVLQVQNASTSISRATAQVTSTGLTLTSVASAVTTTTNFLFSTYTTIQSLATAILALGGGWTCTVVSGFATYPSADLRAVQGALSCKASNADLILHTEDINDFKLDPDRGLVDYPYGFSRGVVNWRVLYSAGFPVIPSEIKLACMEIAAATFKARKTDANLTSQSLGIWSWSRASADSLRNLSAPSYETLCRYKIHSVPRFKQEGINWRR